MQGKFLLFFLYMNYYDFILIKWNLLMWLRTRRTDTILASDGPFLVQPKFHVRLEMKFHQKPNTKRGQSAQYNWAAWAMMALLPQIPSDSKLFDMNKDCSSHFNEY